MNKVGTFKNNKLTIINFSIDLSILNGNLTINGDYNKCLIKNNKKFKEITGEYLTKIQDLIEVKKDE